MECASGKGEASGGGSAGACVGGGAVGFEVGEDGRRRLGGEKQAHFAGEVWGKSGEGGVGGGGGKVGQGEGHYLCFPVEEPWGGRILVAIDPKQGREKEEGPGKYRLSESCARTSFR